MGNQMGNIIRKVRGDDDAAVYVDSRSSGQHPISDELEEKIQTTMREIEGPYQNCLNAFRQKEEALSRQRHDLEQKEMDLQRREQLLIRQKEQFDQNAVDALKSENAHLRQELQKMNKMISASHNSWKMHRDIRPGDVTHENLLEKYQRYYEAHRKILIDLKYTTKEQRCAFLTRILKAAYRHSNEHVCQVATRELELLFQLPDHPMEYHDQQCSTNKEKWMDRSGAFGLLLSAAEVEPKECPESLKQKVFLQLKKDFESFKNAYETNQDGVQSIVDSAIDIAWVMNTLVPPANFHEPEQYYQEWHELVTVSSETDVDPESDDCKLDYCRPILFFGAEGTVGKVGAVKCRKIVDHHNPLLQTACSADPQPPSSIELLNFPSKEQNDPTQLPNTVDDEENDNN